MSLRSSALRTAIPSLALFGILASRLDAQSAESLVTDSTTKRTAPLTPGLSAAARSFGSVLHSVDSSDISRGARPRTLSELLQARLPGVSVLRHGGDPSDGSRIRIRGTVSLLGDASPVVVIDGIPVNTPERLGVSSSLTPSSRFDDFDPEEIDRVDVLPGPAATTLFGAGASNGAIVITTKRGASGRARWDAWSQGAVTSEPTTYPANFRQNGMDPVTGAAAASCSVLDIAAGRCTPTTLDVWNPLESASPFRQGQYRAGGASVAGGPFGIRAFASATARTETSVLDDSEGSRINGRLNAERELFDGFLIGGNVGYVKRDATLRMDHVVQRGLGGTAIDDVNRGYRTPFLPAPPADRDGDRLSRSARIDWRIRPWLQVNGIVGRDELTQRDLRRSVDFTGRDWELATRSWQASSLVHGTAGATHRVARSIRLQTLLSYEESKRRSAYEETSMTTADGTVWSESTTWRWSSIRSWMIQERVDLAGELFVNLGVRRIAGERGDGPGWHPSVDAAWDVGRIVGGPTVRVRGAYAIGVPPRDTSSPVFVFPVWPTDPAASPIDPEQPREAEFGLDASWGSRLALSATYYDQHTPKFITFALAPPSLGGGAAMQAILANMENRGVELGARVRLVDDPTTRWTASATLATVRNRVSELAVPPYVGGPGLHDDQPFGTINRVEYTFIDANGDGLPSLSEMVYSNTSFTGTIIPTREASLRSELALRRWGLTLAAALDHRGGHRAYDAVALSACGFQRCQPLQDPTVPLADKVRAVAGIAARDGSPYLEDASYTRLGELALAWSVPSRFGRVLGNGLTLIVEGRNVATWTKFGGPDPEVATSTAFWTANGRLPLLPAVPRTVGVRVEWR